MQTIFTPWRFKYVSMSAEQEGCFFCQAAADPDDQERLIVWREPHYLVMLNRYPYTNGHLMVAPLEHFADPQQMRDRGPERVLAPDLAMPKGPAACVLP